MSIWISGYFGHHNLGDEAILAAVLSNGVPKDNVKVLTWDFDTLHKIHPGLKGLKSPPFGKNMTKYFIRNGAQLLAEGRKKQGLIIAGGGCLNDHVPGRIVRRKEEVDFYTSKLNRNVGFLGVGANRLELPEDIKALQEMFNTNVKYCSVRDQESYNALQEQDLDMSKVNLTSDVVYGLKTDIVNSRKKTDKLNEAVVAVNLRPLFQAKNERGSDKESKYDNYFKRSVDALLALKDMVGRLVLLPLGTEDQEFLNLLADKTNLNVAPIIENPYTAINDFAEYDLIVGMRYHALIFGLIANTLVLPISYSPKVSSLNRYFKLEGESLYVGDGSELPDHLFTADDFISSVERTWQNREKILSFAHEKTLEHKNITRNDISACMTALM